MLRRLLDARQLALARDFGACTGAQTDVEQELVEARVERELIELCAPPAFRARR